MKTKKVNIHCQVLFPSIQFYKRLHLFKFVKVLSIIFLFVSLTVLTFADEKNFQSAFDRLDQFIHQKMAEENIPGMAVAITDREKLLRVSTYGYADIAAKIPVTPDTVFELGSIGKSFTSIAVLQLHEAGRLDLHAPVTRYLQWFQVQSEYDPITVHHLLNHTSGITNGTDLAPHGAYEVWALREQKTAYQPGKRYYYSNVGFKALGLLLEEMLHQPLGEILKAGILDPLDMTKSYASITLEMRKLMAMGYRSFYDDRPGHSSHPLIPAPWHEYGAGDGCIAATAADAASYLRMIMNRGRGPHGPILSEETFNLMTKPMIEVTKDTYYGYGLNILKIDGYTHIGHGGGTPCYSANILADVDNGFGAVVLINKTGANPMQVSMFALKLLRAILLDKDLPEVPVLKDPFRVDNVADYVGTYKASDKSFTLAKEGNQLILQQGDKRIVLEPRGKDRFYVNHPDYALFLLEFNREENKVVEAFHGPEWYINGLYKGPSKFETPKEWEAYIGHYRSHNPWSSNFRVILRKGVLNLVHSSGQAVPLTSLGKGVFRIGKEGDFPEIIKFDAVASGRALRATLKGSDYSRAFTL